VLSKALSFFMPLRIPPMAFHRPAEEFVPKFTVVSPPQETYESQLRSKLATLDASYSLLLDTLDHRSKSLVEFMEPIKYHNNSEYFKVTVLLLTLVQQLSVCQILKVLY